MVSDVMLTAGYGKPEGGVQMLDIFLPMTTHLEEITNTLRQNLETPIAMNPIKRREQVDFYTRTYWWRTDTTNPIVRGQGHFSNVQLQMVFDIQDKKVGIDFLCIPDAHKGQGKGQIILDKILQIAKQLGYQAVEIDAQESSVPFWLKVGFEDCQPGSSRFPKAMRYYIRPLSLKAESNSA